MTHCESQACHSECDECDEPLRHRDWRHSLAGMNPLYCEVDSSQSALGKSCEVRTPHKRDMGVKLLTSSASATVCAIVSTLAPWKKVESEEK